MARVTIGGRTALHGALHQRRDALREEVRAIAVAISAGLWIEKVALNTVPPVVSDPVDPTLRDELGSLLAQGATDPGLAAVLNAELQDFLARTPPDLGADDELLTALRRGEVAALLQEAAAALDARLATVA